MKRYWVIAISSGAIVLAASVAAFYFLRHDQAELTGMQADPEGLLAKINEKDKGPQYQTGRLSEELVPIDDIGNPESVKNAYYEIYNDQGQALRMIWIANRHGDKLSLEDFFSANDSSIDPGVLKLLDGDQASVFSCGNDGEIRNIALTMYADMDLYAGGIYDEEVSRMRNWEKTMPNDVRGLFFPKDAGRSGSNDQKSTFENGNYRYSKLVLSNGKKVSINYAIVDEYIILSNSKDCIDKTIEQLYYTGTD